MIRGFTRRGQPLMALVLVLGGWVSARAMMWDAGAGPRMTLVRPLAAQPPAKTAPIPALARARPEIHADAGPAPVAASAPEIAAQPLFDRTFDRRFDRTRAPLDEPVTLAGAAVYPASQSAPAPPRPRLVPLPRASLAPFAPAPGATPVQLAGGHRLMWMAALANLPVAAGLIAPPVNSVPFPVAPDQRNGERRWSADGWVLWRRASQQGLAAGGLAPSYGASQAGAVLRYRLAPGSAHRPAAFFRASAALNGSNEREAALGLQARPFGGVPVVLAGEARFTSTAGRGMIRPAIFAFTELPPFDLPLGLRGEAYAQGGYVGGKFATAFADGQLRANRTLLRLGRAEMRLGGGVWGGAQKGASRLDAGPSLIVGTPLGGPASLRLGADWRFRVAGKALPKSGPAVTLSAGF